MHHQAFTLAELLIVTAILGVLFALGIPGYVRWRDSSALRQAQAEISAALINARVTAKRTNATNTVTWTSGTFGGQPLPSGVTITAATMTAGGATSAATSLGYDKPYGTLMEVTSGTSKVLPAYDLTLARGSRRASVHVGGVFGKAIAQPVN